MTHGAEISVVVPVYNGAKYISAAIESIIAQAFSNFELLVIDDGSTDETCQVILEYSDPRIRLIRNERNIGISGTKNRGISEAQGKYVAFLDADDIATPHRLKAQYEFLETHPDFILVGSWIAFIDEGGTLRGGFSRFDEVPDAIPSLLLFDNHFAQSAVMARKEVFSTDLYRDDYPCSEDYDLFARLSMKGKMWNLPQVLTLYREHGEGISKKKRDLITGCTKRIYMWQLARLGIIPSQTELELHSALGCLKECRPVDLGQVTQWLSKLSGANKREHVFGKIFDHILLEKMALACINQGQVLSNLVHYYMRCDITGPLPKAVVAAKILRRAIAKKMFAMKVSARGATSFE